MELHTFSLDQWRCPPPPSSLPKWAKCTVTSRFTGPAQAVSALNSQQMIGSAKKRKRSIAHFLALVAQKSSGGEAGEIHCSVIKSTVLPKDSLIHNCPSSSSPISWPPRAGTRLMYVWCTDVLVGKTPTHITERTKEASWRLPSLNHQGKNFLTVCP